MVVSSSDFTDILVKGQSGGLGALSEAEKIRFSHYYYRQFSIFEQNYRTWVRDPSIWDILWLRALIDEAVKVDEGLINKGSRELWVEAKNYYTQEFIAWVDQNSSEK